VTLRNVRQPPEHRFSGRDVVAGLSVAVILIPQSMAYATLAGVPSHYGLYAGALPAIVAALFASSPYLQTGPVATTSLLTFGALVPIAPVGSPEYVKLAALLALVVGGVRVLVGALRIGWLSYLMSRPLLTGFMSGAAILIFASQLPAALGATDRGPGVLSAALAALSHPAAWDPAAVVLAAATVALIVGGRKLHPLFPGVLFAVVGGTLFSIAAGYEGVTVGAIPAGLPPFSLDLPWTRVPSLVLPGIVIALVGFSEAASISRTFASEDRERWNADREFLSQGAANLASGLSGGFPVGGSFARSALARVTHASSRWAGLVAGVGVLAFLPFSGVLSPLPRAVLSGIVIAAVWSLFRPRELLALWSLSKPQALVGWLTFGLTILLAPHVDHAVLLGILTAGAVHLWREVQLDVTTRREGDLLHVEPRGVLWFGSVPTLEDDLLDHLARERGVARIVIHCQGLGRIDLTGAWTLVEMLEEVRGAGIPITVAGIPEHARRVFHAVGEERWRGSPVEPISREREPTL
jgi:SulP family sulfate permease